MRSNTLDGIPIRLPSPTTVSFPSRKRKSHSPPGKKARRAQAPDHSGAYRIHSEIPDACASIRFSEDPLLWFPEQPDEEKKSETHFYSAGTPAF